MLGFEVNGPTRNQLFNLFEKVGSELEDENCVLERNNIAIFNSIIERHGFLRTNIDVYKVRNVRHKIIYLRNNDKNIMKLIKQSLGEAQAQLVIEHKGPSCRRRSEIYSYEYDESNTDEDVSDSIKSFATVGLVQEGSPAYLGGLCEDDKVIQFGSVDASNFTGISQLQNIVKNSIGKPINIRVRRDRDILDLTVTPNQWEQPGCFGCQLKKQWCIVKITT